MVYKTKTDPLIQIMIQIANVEKCDLMIYGGAQSGIWGLLVKRFLPQIRIKAVEANPNVFIKYYPKLSIQFDSYIHAALTTGHGIANFYVPDIRITKEKSNLRRVDEALFRRYHRERLRAEESWCTTGSLHLDALRDKPEIINSKKMLVPKITLEDLTENADRILLFLDLQGEDTFLLESLKPNIVEKLAVIHYEVEYIESDTIRRNSHEKTRELLISNGFILFADDSVEGNMGFNELFVRKNSISIKNHFQWPSNDFMFDRETINEEISIISRLRRLRVPGISVIGRLLSLLGIDVHKYR
jgi:hypothetical protein